MEKGFEAFGDDVGVGQLVFVGECFPGGMEERSGGGLKPGGEIGVEAFLGLETVGDDDDGAVGEGAVEEGDEPGECAG